MELIPTVKKIQCNSMPVLQLWGMEKDYLLRAKVSHFAIYTHSLN